MHRRQAKKKKNACAGANSIRDLDPTLSSAHVQSSASILRMSARATGTSISARIGRDIDQSQDSTLVSASATVNPTAATHLDRNNAVLNECAQVAGNEMDVALPNGSSAQFSNATKYPNSFSSTIACGSLTNTRRHGTTDAPIGSDGGTGVGAKLPTISRFQIATRGRSRSPLRVPLQRHAKNDITHSQDSARSDPVDDPFGFSDSPLKHDHIAIGSSNLVKTNTTCPRLKRSRFGQNRATGTVTQASAGAQAHELALFYAIPTQQTVPWWSQAI